MDEDHPNPTQGYDGGQAMNVAAQAMIAGSNLSQENGNMNIQSHQDGPIMASAMASTISSTGHAATPDCLLLQQQQQQQQQQTMLTDVDTKHNTVDEVSVAMSMSMPVSGEPESKRRKVEDRDDGSALNVNSNHHGDISNLLLQHSGVTDSHAVGMPFNVQSTHPTGNVEAPVVMINQVESNKIKQDDHQIVPPSSSSVAAVQEISANAFQQSGIEVLNQAAFAMATARQRTNDASVTSMGNAISDGKQSHTSNANTNTNNSTNSILQLSQANDGNPIDNYSGTGIELLLNQAVMASAAQGSIDSSMNKLQPANNLSGSLEDSQNNPSVELKNEAVQGNPTFHNAGIDMLSQVAAASTSQQPSKVDSAISELSGNVAVNTEAPQHNSNVDLNKAVEESPADTFQSAGIDILSQAAADSISQKLPKEESVAVESSNAVVEDMPAIAEPQRDSNLNEAVDEKSHQMFQHADAASLTRVDAASTPQPPPKEESRTFELTGNAADEVAVVERQQHATDVVNLNITSIEEKSTDNLQHAGIDVDSQTAGAADGPPQKPLDGISSALQPANDESDKVATTEEPRHIASVDVGEAVEENSHEKAQQAKTESTSVEISSGAVPMAVEEEDIQENSASLEPAINEISAIQSGTNNSSVTSNRAMEMGSVGQSLQDKTGRLSPVVIPSALQQPGQTIPATPESTGIETVERDIMKQESDLNATREIVEGGDSIDLFQKVPIKTEELDLSSEPAAISTRLVEEQTSDGPVADEHATSSNQTNEGDVLEPQNSSCVALKEGNSIDESQNHEARSLEQAVVGSTPQEHQSPIAGDETNENNRMESQSDTLGVKIGEPVGEKPVEQSPLDGIESISQTATSPATVAPAASVPKDHTDDSSTPSTVGEKVVGTEPQNNVAIKLNGAAQQHSADESHHAQLENPSVLPVVAAVVPAQKYEHGTSTIIEPTEKETSEKQIAKSHTDSIASETRSDSQQHSSTEAARLKQETGDDENMTDSPTGDDDRVTQDKEQGDTVVASNHTDQSPKEGRPEVKSDVGEFQASLVPNADIMNVDISTQDNPQPMDIEHTVDAATSTSKLPQESDTHTKTDTMQTLIPPDNEFKGKESVDAEKQLHDEEEEDLGIKFRMKYPPTQKVTKKRHRQSHKANVVVLAVRHEIQQSCKYNDLANAMRVYQLALDDNMKLEPQTYYNLLNLCDGLERSVHVGTPKVHDKPDPEYEISQQNDAEITAAVEEVDIETRKSYAYRIKQQMDQLKLPLTEVCYTALIKLLSKLHKVEEAQKLVDEAEMVPQCKTRLRLYTPLLLAYCELGHMVQALELWKRIMQQPSLSLTEREYIGLLKCASDTGYANVVELVITLVAEDVSIPSKDFVRATMDWFGALHARCSLTVPAMPAPENNATSEEEITKDARNAGYLKAQALLKEICHLQEEKEGELPPTMGPVVLESQHQRWRISSSCTIDPKTGVFIDGCLKDHALKPCFISPKAWAKMEAMNETIVVKGELEGTISAFQGGRKGKKRRDFSPEERQQLWVQFTVFLQARFPGDEKADVVIDGANVGYFQTNFDSSAPHVDYYQIDWVVRHFLRGGKRVLLFLHERHFSDRLMPEKYVPIVERWQRWGILYQTPAGMNDDWFWMHAAMKYQALVLTNDEMRDHHFQMLAPKMFLRWKDLQQIHFEFGDWEKVGEAGHGDNGNAFQPGSVVVDIDQQSPPPYETFRKVKLIYPEVYSRRVQRLGDGLVIPLTKRGDKNRFFDGVQVAHDDEPDHETYVCIRPAIHRTDTP